MKKNREKLGIECRSLLQRRSSLKNEILQLQEYLNILSVSNLHTALIMYDTMCIIGYLINKYAFISCKK